MYGAKNSSVTKNPYYKTETETEKKVIKIIITIILVSFFNGKRLTKKASETINQFSTILKNYQNKPVIL